MVTIILQTLAANIGSSLTPMGNPQNLYIFSYYKLNFGEFVSVVGLFAVLGLVWLVLLNRRGASVKLEVSLDLAEIMDKKLAILWGAVFFVIVLSVLNIVHYGIAFVLTALTALIINRKLLLKADFPLLITFISLFIFIGNISNIPMIDAFMKKLLSSGDSTYFASILTSQVISNVPSTILLSGFTPHWRELLLGVNVGGMGTIIASLASVISYKLYIGAHPGNTGKYLVKFSIYNLASLALFTFLNYLFLN
jgi:Na+/H+ antiporter NhaD/arsenite permease-like protein